jgi:hypothetical protein
VDVAAASDIWQRAIDAAKLPFGTTVQVSEGTNVAGDVSVWKLFDEVVGRVERAAVRRLPPVRAEKRDYDTSWRCRMAIRMTRNAGMLLLAIWLILTGIAGFAALPIPGVLMSALALIAGVLILVGM